MFGSKSRKINELNLNIITLKRQLEKITKEYASVKPTIDQLKTRCNALTEENRFNISKINLLSTKNEKLSSEIDDLTANNKKLVTENENLIADNEALVSENKKLTSDNKELVSETAALRYKNRNLDSENTLLNVQNKRLSDENAKLIDSTRTAKEHEVKKEKEHYDILNSELKSQIHAARVEENKFIAWRNSLTERFNSAIEKQESEINDKAKALSEEILKQKIDHLEIEHQRKLNDLTLKQKELDSLFKKLQLHPDLLEPFKKNYYQELYLNSIRESVLQHAFDTPPKIEKIDVYARIHSTSSENIYRTTLTECSCPDHGFRDRPCKHMLYLAFTLGLLQISQKDLFDIVSKYNKYGVKKHKTEEEIKILEAKQNKLQAVNSELIRAINETPNAYPRIAGMMADIVALQFRDSEVYLRSKSPPAHKAADEVARMKEKVRTLVKYNEEWKDKVETLHRWFPNIDDVFNAGFKVDEWELEVREPTAYEIKDYISKYINTVKFENLKRK